MSTNLISQQLLEHYAHLKDIISSVAGFLVPPHSQRIPITPQNLYVYVVPHVPVLIMAGLARTRGTWLIRLAFLPFAIAVILRYSFGYYFDSEYLHGLNHGLGATGFVEFAYVIFFAWSKQGVLKVGEVEPGVRQVPSSNGNGKHNNKAKTPCEDPQHLSSSPNFLLRGSELLLNARGIGWKFGTGTGVYWAPDPRDLSSRSTYLRQTLWEILKSYILLDVLNSILAHSNIRVAGGTIFGRGGNWLESLAISTFLTLVTGTFLVIGFNFSQLALSFFAVLLGSRGDGPLVDVGWGPLMDRPWATTSLHDFWGVRWQQFLRQPFLILGGYPLQAIFRTITRVICRVLCLPETKARQFNKIVGDVGLFVGVFFASGLSHTLPPYACGPVVDPVSGRVISETGMPGWHTMFFFLAQAIGILIERIYRMATGKYVDGVFGRVWTWVWIVGGGQFLFNSWYQVGFQRGLVMDPATSPTEQLLFRTNDSLNGSIGSDLSSLASTSGGPSWAVTAIKTNVGIQPQSFASCSWIFIERIYRTLTGKYVDGIFGRVWNVGVHRRRGSNSISLEPTITKPAWQPILGKCFGSKETMIHQANMSSTLIGEEYLGHYHDLKHLVFSAFSFLAPPQGQRIPITTENLYVCGLPFVALVIMAGLARTRGTWLIRLGLLPVAATVVLRYSLAYYFVEEDQHGLNHGRGALAFVGFSYVIFYAWSKDGVLKIDETEPGVPLVSWANENGNGKQNGHTRPPNMDSRSTSSPGFFTRAFELLLNGRGIGWKFGTGTGVYWAPDLRDLSSRSAFLQQTLWQIATTFLVYDLTNSILARAGIRVAGGTIFGKGGNWVESLAISTGLTLVTAASLAIGYNLCQLLLSFFAVLLGGQRNGPLVDVGWGPLMDRPWAATSLHNFWGARWQQAVRQPFLVLGGYPLQAILRVMAQAFCLILPISSQTASQTLKLAGDTGFVIGTFFASGLIHTLPHYACGPMVDPVSGRMISASGIPSWHSMAFFVAQAAGLFIERLYRASTGKYVDGALGRVWTLVWLIVGGQFLSPVPDGSRIDLHDLAVLFMYERMIREQKFGCVRLTMYKEGPLEDIEPYSWDVKPGENRKRHYIEVETDSSQEERAGDIPASFNPTLAGPVVTPESFEAPNVKLPPRMASPIPYRERETMFWRLKNFDSGYALTYAMQTILDTLPTSATLVIRTKKKAHNIEISPPSTFAMMELPVRAHELTHLLIHTSMGGTRKLIREHITRGDGGYMPWIYMLLGEARSVDLASDTRVVLDLGCSLLGGRGPCGELFALQRSKEYMDNTLASFADDIGGELKLSGRLVFSRDDHQEYRQLAEATLAWMYDIIVNRASFCGHCGRPNASQRCSKCKVSHFCSAEHQRAAWAFHKIYCNEPALG
ncbi:hypothetical protein DL93DRAFT_2098346 [Clavulina sp. PMI_390]|nr:hypothetical protein DL93DRAFT_2098346 [Clavulina sp. PMI_390]